VESSASALDHPGHEREAKGEYLAWVRSLRDQCEEAGVPCFVPLDACEKIRAVKSLPKAPTGHRPMAT